MSKQGGERERIVAPWGIFVVEALEKRQLDPNKHPYTCSCGEIFTPKRMGWHCRDCFGTQTWAYRSDIR